MENISTEIRKRFEILCGASLILGLASLFNSYFAGCIFYLFNLILNCIAVQMKSK